MTLLLWAAAAVLAGGVDDLLPEDGARFSRGAPDPVAQTPWWQGLGDPELGRVVTQALGGNDDLEAAWARVDQSRAVARQTASPLLPSLSANGSYTATPADVQWFSFGGSPPQPPPSPTAVVADPVISLRGTLDARWLIDLWGKDQLAWRAARYDRLATQGDTQAAALSVSVAVGEAWYDHALAAERLRVVRDQVQTNRDLLEVVELRYGADATGLDVLQQRQQLASTEALLPAAEAGADLTRQRLAVLLGEDPSTWTTEAGALPAVGEAPAVGTPADLVEHRPDLRAATARAEGARRRKMSAQRTLLPQLTATGQWGRQSTTTWEDEPQDGPVASYGVSVSVPLFQGGRTWSGVQAATAGERAAMASWEQSFRLAVADVEGSLRTDEQARDALAAQERQLEAATLAFDEARLQYLEGTYPFLNVQSALVARQVAELSVLQARRDRVGARIQLHEAVGGPWTASLAPEGGS